MNLASGVCMSWSRTMILGLLLLQSPTSTGAENGLPGASIADAKLKKDVLGIVQIQEMVFGAGCQSWRIVDTEVTTPPAQRNIDPWVERWTVDRCGTTVRYRIAFTPSPHGGTRFGVGLIKDEEQIPPPAAAEPAKTDPAEK